MYEHFDYFYNRTLYNSRFSAPQLDAEEPADRSFERRDWKVSDYFGMYLDHADFNNICSCTSLKYLKEFDKPMNLTTQEVKKFFGISVLMSCLKFPQIKMYWAALTRAERISRSMTRKRFFMIRNHLKVVIDNDISDDTRRADKLWKIKPLMIKLEIPACLWSAVRSLL